MCGICFFYDTTKDSIDNDSVELMVKCLHHRGPDAHRTLKRRYVALGHTRLSIVDIKGGHQPMLSADDRYAIIYNGEIYNYRALKKQLESKNIRLTTESDTEVVLQMFIEYGPQCVAYLRGMFSFAVHDNKTGELFVARDRLGIKPLFYFWDGSYLIAASEMKAIFASGFVEPELNKNSLVNYFKYQFSIAPFTLFENIFELEPGYSLSIEPNGHLSLNHYWDLEFPEQGDYESLQEQIWVEKFKTALDDSVTSHLIGEVPIGAYLSGGIDSATTTCLLKKHYNNEVQSFTIGFDNKLNDESQVAISIANEINVPNLILMVNDDKPGGYLGLLIDALYYLEQPQRVAVDIPYLLLSEFARKNKYNVVFTGDGADEVLAGYDCYRQDSIRVCGNDTNSQLEREQYYLNNYAGIFARQYLQMIVNLHEPSRQQQTIDLYGCYPVWFDTWQILDDFSRNIFCEDFLFGTKPHQQMSQLIERVKPKLVHRHPINQSLYIEAKTRLSGWILWKSDRLSMAHGVEARVPFMDHHLVEIIAQIPPNLKLKGMDEKYILKKTMGDYLPKHPNQFKKRAFYAPIREWFFTSEKIVMLKNYLSDSAIEKAGIFNVRQVNNMIDRITALPNPKTIDDHYTLMRLEWGLMLVLSIQILHWLYVEKHAPCFNVKAKPKNT